MTAVNTKVGSSEGMMERVDTGKPFAYRRSVCLSPQ